MRKMVNVHSQMPFNLHNQALNPRFHPSTSRSTSLSATNTYPTHLPVTGEAPSRRSSPSRSAQCAPAHTSELNGCERNPILNVRLVGVATVVPGESAGGNDPFGERGRKRGRIVVDEPAPGKDICRSLDDALVPVRAPGDCEPGIEGSEIQFVGHI
jgi:hypothetical protein